MNRTYSRALAGAAAVTLSIALAGCGGARSEGGGGGGGDGDSFTIKFSHVVTTETPKGKAAEEFKKVLEEKTDGRITVEIYPNSELYGDEDELQALQSNSVQMLAPASAKFTTLAPELQVLDLPFLFDTVEDIPTIVAPDSAVGKAIYENQKLADNSTKVLGLWDNGLKSLSSNKPMHKPSDLEGLSFRIQPSDLLRAQFESWGADATPMAFGEVYNALQQRVIDGQENPYSNIESQKMHTVQKHITELNHGYIGYVLVINNEFFESLPDDLQTAVQEAADEASVYNREVATEVNAAAKKSIEDAGTTTIYTPTQQERQAFKDLVVPSVWNEFAGVIGEDLLAEVLKTTQ